MKTNLVIISLMLISCVSFSQREVNDLNSTKPPTESEGESVSSQQNTVGGFYNRISVGVLGGSNSSPSFHIVNGYRFNGHWSAGLGLGTEQFLGWGYIPIFIEGNYRLLKNGTSPFLSVMSGYELPMRNVSDNRGGFTCGGRLGFDFFVNPHVGISTSIGYRFAYLRDFSNWGGFDDFVTISEINRYEFRVGIIFQ